VPSARWSFTDRAAGDLAGGSAGVEQRRSAVVDLPWTWLRQVHGAGVVVVRSPGAHAGAPGDAVVTATPGAAIAVQVADCAPVLLVGDGPAPVVGVVHAGWRGIVAGVVPAAVAAMRELGAVDLRATIGPCIAAGCYEFGEADLDRLAALLGERVRARTQGGAPALDVRIAVHEQLGAAGVGPIEMDTRCSACDPDLCSFRADGDLERQALVAWIA
jgi:YfiH family protein